MILNPLLTFFPFSPAAPSTPGNPSEPWGGGRHTHSLCINDNYYICNLFIFIQSITYYFIYFTFGPCRPGYPGSPGTPSFPLKKTDSVTLNSSCESLYIYWYFYQFNLAVHLLSRSTRRSSFSFWTVLAFGTLRPIFSSAACSSIVARVPLCSHLPFGPWETVFSLQTEKPV